MGLSCDFDLRNSDWGVGFNYTSRSKEACNSGWNGIRRMINH